MLLIEFLKSEINTLVIASLLMFLVPLLLRK